MRTATRILKEGHPNFASPLEAMKRDATIHRACRLATETHDAVVFEVWAWRKLVRPTLEWGQLPTVVGYVRSEEHTSELQSLMRISYAVFCLKKKRNQTTQEIKTT